MQVEVIAQARVDSLYSHFAIETHILRIFNVVARDHLC